MIEVTTTALEATKLIAQLLFDKKKGLVGIPHGQTEAERSDAEQNKRELVIKLLASGIDPLVFDALLSNEIDRKLKTRFGVVFVALTIIFTATSYLIIVVNAPLKLGISDVAMTGLIIETPIQFVGLLYIIARNLFPSTPRASDVVRQVNRKKKSQAATNTASS
jgi:hypothetical protein